MAREELFGKLTEIFRDVFDMDDIVLGEETTAEDIEPWDSLTHITLISEIEDAFGIHFQMREVTRMKNVGEMADRILELLG